MKTNNKRPIERVSATGAGTGTGTRESVRTSAVHAQYAPSPVDFLPSVTLGDITGTQGARGEGTGQARRKWQGEGRDLDAERAEQFADACAQWPELAAQLSADEDTGKRLLALGTRSAHKAARHVRHLRGVTPSDTSLLDAASDATFAGLVEVCGWEAMLGSIPWQSPAMARRLGLMAWRAAFASLTGRTDGIRCRRGAQGTPDAPPPQAAALSARELQVAAVSLQAWARGETQPEPELTQSDLAKRDASAWVWNVLSRSVSAPMSPNERRSPAGQARIKGARARAVCIIRMVHGDSFTEAAQRAGYPTPRAAAESLRKHEIFATLARASEREQMPCLDSLRAELRRAGKAAGRAVQRARGALSALHSTQYGVRGFATNERGTWRNPRASSRSLSDLRTVSESELQSAASVQGRGQLIRTVTTRSASIVSPARAQWSQLVEERERALDWAKFVRNRIIKRRKAMAKGFKDAATGLWAGAASKAAKE